MAVQDVASDTIPKVDTKAFEKVFPITSTDRRDSYFIMMFNPSSRDALCFIDIDNRKEKIYVIVLKKTFSNQTIKVKGLDTKFKYGCIETKTA